MANKEQRIKINMSALEAAWLSDIFKDLADKTKKRGSVNRHIDLTRNIEFNVIPDTQKEEWN